MTRTSHDVPMRLSPVGNGIRASLGVEDAGATSDLAEDPRDAMTPDPADMLGGKGSAREEEVRAIWRADEIGSYQPRGVLRRAHVGAQALARHLPE